MFGDKYKKDMDKIKAPDDAVSRIAEGMRAHGKKRKVNFKKIIAVAACVTLLIGMVAIYPAINLSESLSNAVVDGKQDVSNKLDIPEDIWETSASFDESAPSDTDGYATYNQLCAAITDRISTYKAQNDYWWGDWENAWGDDVLVDEGMDLEEAVPDAPGSTDNFFGNSADQSNKGETEDFSDTNNQVSGVQEADVIKTDGKFIYTVKKNILSVFSANEGEVSLACKITLEHECRDMMLVGSRLVIISKNINDTPHYTDTDWNTVTKVYAYEIDEKGKASLADEFVQSGYYISSRMVDGKLVLVTNHIPEYNRYFYDESYEMTQDGIIDSLPLANGKTLHPECIIVPNEIIGTAFLVVSSFDVSNGKSNSLSIMGAGANIYADADSLYVYCTIYKDDGRYTVINRFSTAEGELFHSGSVMLKGYFNNQYSFDEHNGYLRVALTRNDDNVLYVLDKDLETVGYIDGMGKNERIKSVRYYGDIAYVVTFRQTDPLYAIDISDPANPVILSELKIPGFSTYMQSYGENKMFGFGNDADINTGWTQGIKLSMFDTTDPNDVKEEATFLLGKNTYFADNVLKAVSVQYDKGIIMFPYVDHSNVEDGRFVAEHVFALYTYTENGFTLLGKDVVPYDYNVANVRGIYIDDYIYVITLFYDGNATVNSYTINDLTPVDACKN